MELGTLGAPFHEENHYKSWANERGYKIGMETDGVTNKLTRKEDGLGGFTITELEVWSLKHN